MEEKGGYHALYRDCGCLTYFRYCAKFYRHIIYSTEQVDDLVLVDSFLAPSGGRNLTSSPLRLYSSTSSLKHLI